MNSFRNMGLDEPFIWVRLRICGRRGGAVAVEVRRGFLFTVERFAVAEEAVESAVELALVAGFGDEGGVEGAGFDAGIVPGETDAGGVVEIAVRAIGGVVEFAVDLDDGKAKGKGKPGAKGKPGRPYRK